MSANTDFPPEPVVPVCAIGASAGGVKALQQLFSSLRDDLGFAYVVIVHLSPDHPSQLSEILAGRTSMPVLQVDDSPDLKPNCVFVIAPDRELVVAGGKVTSRPISEPRSHRAPIDMFFRSVATCMGDGLAVVLSGAGSDGALGIRAVKEAGGVIFVQDPSDAEYPMMPRNAIATGVVDFVLPVAQLAARIAEVARSKHALKSLTQQDAEADLRRIIGFLKQRTGHDFGSYKRSTLLRRVTRRMQVARQVSFEDYCKYMQANPEEAQELFSDLLISVTMFFRDPSAFEVLAEKAIGPIFERPLTEGPVRAWVVGCATGEEAYSLAMLLLEEAGKRDIQPQMQIFASDLDEGALATAREGRYPKAIEADVSEQRLRRFFVEDGAHYRVRKEVRDLVLFSSHSALKDPPFIRLDLVTCRNLMIYLERDLQRRMCDIFHYALKPNGFLFVGSAETVDTTELYESLDRDARIFVAKPMPGRHMPAMPFAHGGFALSVSSVNHKPPSEAVLLGQGHATALEATAPPSLLTDATHRILHLSSTVGRFFLPSQGPFTAELSQLVRPELRTDLKLALHRVFEHREPTVTLPVPVSFEGGFRRIVMHVAPVPTSEGASPQALVYFIDGGQAESQTSSDIAEGSGGGEMHRLTEALMVAQERLAESRTEYETATQELRAANEELQSINEEYRSTSEELETSKEELQSMNEELQTVNSELKLKLESISSAHNDLRNLMSATEIGTLFLDPDLRIKLFTPAASNYFNITDSDIGRVITDFTHRLVYDAIESDVAESSARSGSDRGRDQDARRALAHDAVAAVPYHREPYRRGGVDAVRYHCAAAGGGRVAWQRGTLSFTVRVDGRRLPGGADRSRRVRAAQGSALHRCQSCR